MEIEHREVTRGGKGGWIQWLALASMFLGAYHLSYGQEGRQDSDNQGHVHKYLDWQAIAELPVGEGGQRHPGLAGAFSGISNGVLIIAGGANFPIAPPWQGGKKVWSDRIYVLEKDRERYSWKDIDGQSLRNPVAYGVSISTPQGILCVGGENGDGLVQDIFLLTWNAISGRVEVKSLARLPAGFEVTAGAITGGALYVAGISNAQNAMIRVSVNALLDSDRVALSWDDLRGCPGPTRRMPAYAAQSDGEQQCLFLFGGRDETYHGVDILTDGYFYNVTGEAWHRIDHCPPVMAAAALPYGTNNILIFGGDDGALLLERDSLQRLIDGSKDQQRIETARIRLTNSFQEHPGFRQDVLAFNTITGTFQYVGKMPPAPAVVTDAVTWNGKIILPGGETRPGVRTPVVFASAIHKKQAAFQWLDYGVLILYFIVLLVIGLYFSARQNSTDDYFIGGGRVPWWAAGLSVFGTALSAITFMAIPAKTFATDWTYFFYNMSVLLTAPLIIVLFIPFYRRLKITTAYEYLEQRFNVSVRLFGSLSFIFFQLGRIAIILYLPAIALSLVTGIDIFICILAVGILSTAYTLVGGIEAVIWTDVVQVIVLMSGALLSLVFIFESLGDDFGVLASEAYQKGKFTLANMEFALNEPTIWVVVVGGFFVNLVSYSTDQSLVQRYLTTKDEKSAGKTVWTNALLVIPATLIFFGVGTALYMFYIKFPAKLDPFTENNDSIFPWYITNELPAGISGLLIAGLFSAAMSSLSSSMNSISTAFTTDFFRRFRKTASLTGDLGVARVATLLSGVVGIAFAFWLATSDVLSLWDKFFEILGLFTGGLGGVFLLGMLFKRAHGRGAVVGLVISSSVQYLVSKFLDIHVFLYVATGLITCVAVGYLASLMIPDNEHDEKRRRLTFHNL